MAEMIIAAALTVLAASKERTPMNSEPVMDVASLDVRNPAHFNCCFCGRDLTNGLSQERGYGPDCAGKYGMLMDTTEAPVANADELVEAAIAATTESRRHVAEGVRGWRENKVVAAKRLAYLLAYIGTKAEQDAQLKALAGIGFTSTAGIIALVRGSDAVVIASKRRATVEIRDFGRWGKQICVFTPEQVNTQSLEECRALPGRHWNREIKANTFPLTSWDAAMAWTQKWFPVSLLPDKPAEVVEAESKPVEPKAVKEEVVRLDLCGKRIQIESPYNVGFVAEIKDMPARQWTCLTCGKPARPKCEQHPTDKHGWTLPLDRAPALKELVKRYYPKAKTTMTSALAAALGVQSEKLEAATVVNGEAKLSLPGGEPYPFQVAGVKYLEAAGGCAIVADEQGLGKTLQALAYISKNVPREEKVLYVVPANVKYNWISEIAHWLGGAKLGDRQVLRTARKLGKVTVGGEEIAVLNGGEPSVDRLARHTIINYDALGKWEETLVAAGFQTVVADEAHYLKNDKSKRSKSFAEIVKSATRRILLTGTPVLNRPRDLWNLLRTIDNDTWGNFFKYGQRYCDGWRDRFGWKFDGASNMSELNDRLNGHQWIRRLKADVLSDLPEKMRHHVALEIGDKERRAYQRVENDGAKVFHSCGHLASSGDSEARAQILAHITRLRVAAGQAKLEAAGDWIQDLVDSCGKVVVFARHKEVVEGLAERFGGLKIDGSVSPAKRADVVAQFQSDPEAKVIICSIEAASVGITLTTIWYLDVPETFDEALRAIQEWKAERADAITDGIEIGQSDEAPTAIDAFNDYFKNREKK